MARKLIYLAAAIGLVLTILLAAVANVNHGHGPGHHSEEHGHDEHGESHDEHGEEHEAEHEEEHH